MSDATRMERKKAKTKERIFQTALELFLQQGYESTTVEQIAEKADIAKGTFFNYFPTKDSIVHYLGEQRLALMEHLLENELKNISSAKEKIYKWLEVFGAANEKDKEILNLIVRVVLSKLLVDAKPQWDNNDIFRNILAGIIKEGQDSGEFRRDFEAGYIADILVYIYYMVLFQWLGQSLEKPLGDEYKARVEILLAGIIS